MSEEVGLLLLLLSWAFGRMTAAVSSSYLLIYIESLVMVFMNVLHADLSYGPLQLSFEPYQDHANGCIARQVDNMVAWIGTLQCSTPKVRD